MESLRSFSETAKKEKKAEEEAKNEAEIDKEEKKI